MAKKNHDEWIKEKIKPGSLSLTRKDIDEYQLKKINETLQRTIDRSPFYKEKFRFVRDKKISALEEISDLPFTTQEELAACGREMLCVSERDISRIVSLETSGSTGNPKRIYFTEEDQELTVDYFHYGMENIVSPLDVVMILLPCKTPGSVGDLLAKGLKRLGCRVVAYGFPDVSSDYAVKELGEIIADKGVTSIVGSPQEALVIARGTEHTVKKKQIHSILLSTDFIPDALCEDIEKLWGCKVFEHYGMTEMGLGGAVGCCAFEGYHPRENDLLFEIINPATGRVLADGEYGEIVFSTLTRKGMPLIRYRTGDISRFIPGPCKCGSILKRIDKVKPRQAKKGTRGNRAIESL